MPFPSRTLIVLVASSTATAIRTCTALNPDELAFHSTTSLRDSIRHGEFRRRRSRLPLNSFARFGLPRFHHGNDIVNISSRISSRIGNSFKINHQNIQSVRRRHFSIRSFNNFILNNNNHNNNNEEYTDINQDSAANSNSNSKSPIYYDDFAIDPMEGKSDDSYYYSPVKTTLYSVDPMQDCANYDIDLTGASLRQFSLGQDILLTRYIGSLGFDKVTDWQYYYLLDDDDRNYNNNNPQRVPTSPRPMDPSQPSRTRSSSGTVVRLFLGEFRGALASILRSRGLDIRVWIKEYSGEKREREQNSLSSLAMTEQRILGSLLSKWCEEKFRTGINDNTVDYDNMQQGRWREAAQHRHVDNLTQTTPKKDNDHLNKLLQLLSSSSQNTVLAPFPALLGTVNLNDYYDNPNPNQWYKSLGVPPPQPQSTWLVFDYHGFTTASSYAVPMLLQQSKLPPKRGFFGNIVSPPPLPPFQQRAHYMMQGVLKGMLTAVANAHEAGIVHNSLGRNSFLLSSVGQDKREATTPYAVTVQRLRVVLIDWGFAATLSEAVEEEEFCGRARMLGIPIEGQVRSGIFSKETDESLKEFAKAEDLHALGFVFLAMLFSTLAEPTNVASPMPPTDDDSWQRLFSEIFEKDMEEFREYCANEEVWNSVVEWLDKDEGAGWSVLGELLLARERVVKYYYGQESRIELMSAQKLLSHPFFQRKSL